jgi:thiol-disulfide isomerase/thioredoxin
MKKNIVLPFLALILITTCCETRNEFTVEGLIKNRKENTVYLSIIEINYPILIDSSEIDRKGRFSFRIKTRETGFYQVGCSKNDFITLLAKPGEKIKLTFNGDNLSGNYTVSGSKGSAGVRELDLELLRTKMRIDSLDAIYNIELKNPGPVDNLSRIEQEYLEVYEQQRNFNINFILNNVTSLASIRALYQKINDELPVLNSYRDLQLMKLVSDSLKVHYPGSKYTRALVNDFEKKMFNYQVNRLEMITKDLPITKLDPVLPDINGKMIALSSLKGKYVLLAFWSTRLQECIIENIQLKEYYKLYRNKGFEIYQVNLDNDESAWKAAVKYDELPWISTREGDPEDQRYARMFNVRSLPANYLVNRDGEIIASNLHGRMLQIKLAQIFK